MMAFLETLGPLFAPMPLFLIFIGTLLGIIVGAIPGLTGSMLIVRCRSPSPCRRSMRWCC